MVYWYRMVYWYIFSLWYFIVWGVKCWDLFIIVFLVDILDKRKCKGYYNSDFIGFK